MVLISDGEDNLSNHTRTEAIEMAQRTSVVIYTISTSIQWISLTQNNEPAKSGDRKYHLTEWRQDSSGTRGRNRRLLLLSYHVDDLDQSFQDIGDELRNQYSIAYLPNNYVSTAATTRSASKSQNIRATRCAPAAATSPAPTQTRRPQPVPPAASSNLCFDFS